MAAADSAAHLPRSLARSRARADPHTQFLFRYASDTSRKVKGVPLDVENYVVSIALDAEDDHGEVLPFAFKLTSVYKTYLMSCSTEEERDKWVSEIAGARERAIKLRLGHAAASSWEQVTNKQGERLVDIKIKQDKVERDFNCQPY